VLRSITILSLLLIFTWGARSFAEAPEVEARHHFEDGSKAYALGEFQRAIAEYRAAYNSKPDPAILYNIAQAYRLSGDMQQALFFYRSYLRQDPKAPNRKEVDKRIHDLDEQVRQHRALSSQPPNETVAPGKILPTEQEAPESPPPPSTTKPAEVTPPPSTPELTAVTATPQSKPVYKKAWLWAVVGVAVVGVAVGLGVGLTVGASPSAPSSHFGDFHVF
jgi:tetratricopeptide (TPR) repeat protein